MAKKKWSKKKSKNSPIVQSIFCPLLEGVCDCRLRNMCKVQDLYSLSLL